MPDQSDLLSLCKRRGFIWPSYEIYGGVAGMFDYGPLGCVLKNNIVETWRSIYKNREGFIEIDSETVNPVQVFKASGHVDEFSDLITYCDDCKEPFRADHLVKGLHENPDILSPKELEELFRKNDVRCPECKGKLGPVEDFNLMFKTTIGPGSSRVGYLRPETAQGIFVNFLNLYRYNRDKLPLGVIQTGRGYRNEIAPRQGMIRMREFNMMEVELFVDPDDKGWERFPDVENEKMTLIPKDGAEIVITVGDAVRKGIIANKVLAYFVYTTQQLMLTLGLDPKKLRFRQHLSDEMAHYAADCWDAEALLSYGWTEITGVADRGCWDLSRHAEFSGADMTHFRRFDEPKEIERDAVKAKHKALGPKFKEKAKLIAEAIESKRPEDIKNGSLSVTVGNDTITLGEEFFEVARIKEKVSGERVIPHVIEPSYGLDRIFYSILEHAYSYDEKDDYVTLRLKPNVAPIKAGVFPLMDKDGLDVLAASVYKELQGSGIPSYYDASGAIGRRYARMDEIGTPWCITVDYASVEDGKEKGTVTIRDRDTREQKRIKVCDTEKIIRKLLSGTAFGSL
ncbi:MAG: glycine--tRNA ligase [Methanomassiliicoccaceae archaeon]|nr:glycine--tRNA ligase [Methanomassiliicoccaceae archaeon]